MKEFYNYDLLCNIAYEIIEMRDELYRLRKENQELKEYEDKYNKLLSESIHHTNKMHKNMIDVLLTPGVVNALERK